MKVKMIAVLSVMTAVAFIIGGAACSHSSKEATPASGQTVAYYTCPMHPSVKSDKPGSCPVCGMGLQPVYENAVATNNTPSSTTNNATADDTKPKPYPFDICLVDGMKLGSMGDPYVFVYQGQEIKFCCAGCKPDFLKDPDKYMKKMQDAETAATK
jgi:YHS domain-containing protein